MAKRLYEEEYIGAIANKIRSLVPSLNRRKFTTAQMPDGIQRVYEEGQAKGQNEGYKSGYSKGYRQGYSSGNTDGHNTGYNEGYNEGFSEGIDLGEQIAISSIPRAEGVGF
jgi:flagellar biosynthesis/type III secretory pathway protein FliH